jgi:hypothetical protein
MTRQQPRTWGEMVSDANGPEQGVYDVGGSLWHVPPVGSIPHQLSQARSEGTASSHDQAVWGSYGAAREGPRERAKLLTNGQTSDEAYRDEQADIQDLYGP